MEKDKSLQTEKPARPQRKKILFVCTGNTCRSPIAQAVFKREIKKRKIKYHDVSSAGISARQGDGLSEGARRVLLKYGLTLNKFKSRRLTKRLVQNAYVVICMNKKMKDYLRDFNNVYCFEEFIGEDVPDPYGYGEEAYEYVYKLLCYAAPIVLDKIIVNP